MQELAMPDGHNLIAGAVDDEHGTAHVADLVDVGTEVPRQREAQVEGYPIDGDHGALQDYAAHSGQRGEVHGRCGADGAAVRDDLCPRGADHVPDILECGLDVGIHRGLVYATVARAHAIARVLVGEDVDLEHVAHLAEVPDNEAQVLCVAVAEKQRVLRALAADVKGRDDLAARGGQPYQVGVLGVGRRHRWLKDEAREVRAHGRRARGRPP
mmetsp:Transcript_149822/g.417461  ORF Transcript_149822/g.417461 Transcript_149822/m.417461 type:complete len:213 (+) Transcript_149822:259-897(+)